jgi:CubicO group peptidase (beta-lactamase class C family)
MVIEADMAGNCGLFLRLGNDTWLKFGLLYLHKGNWNGEQILEESWVKYVATPTSEGAYGAQFWLNAGGKFPDAQGYVLL